MDFSYLFNFLESPDVTTVLVGLLVFLVAGYFISMQVPAGIPPGPPFLPIIGNLHNLKAKKYIGKRHLYLESLRQTYGNIFRFYFADQLVVILNDFESIEEAFVKQSAVFSYRPTEKLWGAYQSVKKGGGVIWANGKEWKDCRRMGLQTLRDLGVGKSTLEDRIMDETGLMVDILAKSEGKPVRVHKVLMAAATNIISTVVFGQRYEYDDPNLLSITAVIDAAFKSEGSFSTFNRFPSLRFLPFVASKLLTIRNSVIEVEKFISKCIEEHKKTFTKGCLNDFIDYYLDTCNDIQASPISEGCIRKAILDFFVAGSDTTATTLDWAFLFMVLNEDVQKKCQEQIDKVVGSGRVTTWSDRKNMPYVEATLLEAQRLGNTIPLSLAHTTSEDAWVKGYLIPKGSFVYANLRACQLDPNYWNEPLKFQPERFLNADGMVKKQFPAFLPFSAGPRICPGDALAKMEMFLFFTGILQRFTLSTVDGKMPSTDGICGVSLSALPYDIQVKSRSF